MVSRNNRIIFHCKDYSFGSILYIYIRTQIKVYILHEKYWKHWKLHVSFGQSHQTKVDTSFIKYFQIPEEVRSLIVLPCKFGVMGVINPTEMAKEKYMNSHELTKKLAELYYTIRTQLQNIRRNKRIGSKIWRNNKELPFHCKTKCPTWELD